MVQEPNWKSSRHIGKMILMVTTATVLPHLAKLYPYYYEKHKSYLSDIYPEYFRDHKDVKPKEKKPEAQPTQNILSLPSTTTENRFRIENILFQEILNCFSGKLSIEQQVSV